MTRSLYDARVAGPIVSLFTLGRRQVLTLPVDANGDPTSVTVKVYSDQAGTTQVTDLLAEDGTTPITQLTIPAGSAEVPRFYGPDAVVDVLWLGDPDADGDFYPVAPLAADAAAAAAAARDQAQQAAASVPGMWQPNTVYTAGSVKVAPDGSSISRNADGTSRATFDATEQAAWTVVLSKSGTLEQAALSASYVGVGSVAQRIIPASLFQPSNGTPAMTAFASGHAGWALDAAATEGVATWIDFIPPWWKTFNLAVIAAPTTNGGGNIQLDVSYGFFVSDQVLTAGTYISGASNLQAVSTTASTVRLHTLLTGIANASTKMPFLRILRAGSASGDTYAADLAFLGVLLTRSS